MPSENSAVWMQRIPLIITIGIGILVLVLVLPAIQQVREVARRTQSQNNLKSVGLALNNYHDVYQRFPHGGIFDEGGVGYHGWTTCLDPFLAQSAFYSFVNQNVPWDDPENIDLFLGGVPFTPGWQNPSISQSKSPDGLPLLHYAANQWVMHRNSHIRIKDFSQGTSAIFVVGDANGAFDPLGYPYIWRDIADGLRESDSGFGCPVRTTTMFLMADGSVRDLSNSIDRQITQRMAGPPELKPTSDQVAKPSTPYRLDNALKYWRFDFCLRGHKTLMTFRLSPDGKFLKVDFGHANPKEAESSHWLASFQVITNGRPIEEVQLAGRLTAEELIPLLKIKTLKRLTISNATITGDTSAVLKTARSDIELD